MLLCAPATVSLRIFARESISAPLQGVLLEQFWIPFVKEQVKLGADFAELAKVMAAFKTIQNALSL
jgi:hypothetical protein